MRWYAKENKKYLSVIVVIYKFITKRNLNIVHDIHMYLISRYFVQISYVNFSSQQFFIIRLTQTFLILHANRCYCIHLLEIINIQNNNPNNFLYSKISRNLKYDMYI